MIGNKCMLAAALALAPLATQAAETVYSFESVTGIEHRIQEVLITGVLINNSTPTTVTLPWPANASPPHPRCEQLFDVVLSQPGAYRLTVVTDTKIVYEGGGTPTEVLFLKRCASELNS